MTTTLIKLGTLIAGLLLLIASPRLLGAEAAPAPADQLPGTNPWVVFYLGLDDQLHAEEDIKTAIPSMLRAMWHKESVRVPRAYYEVGAIAKKDLSEYLALLGLIAGREFSFGSDLDEAAKRRKLEEWQQWWKKEGKLQKLDLGPLKDHCETQRMAFREREISLKQEVGRKRR